MARLPILTYHSLDNSGSPLSVDPAQFRRQMQWLHEQGWTTLDANGLLQGHRQGTWPARSCVLTFDDGFANFAEQALPILRDFGFTAHVFVVSDWVGRRNDWPGQPGWVPRLPLMDWSTLRDVTAAGVALGAHTLSHPHLARIGVTEAEREIVTGKRTIEEQTGRPVDLFSYPYGEANAVTEHIVAETFCGGFGTQLAFATAASRLTCFERLDMFYLRDSRLFSSLERLWLRGYIDCRRRLRLMHFHN